MIKILGDPHLGRRWTNSVPLHRRGDRERMVNEQFAKELDPGPALLHVCMGDLFDDPDADLDTIMFAAREYRKAAFNHPKVRFVVIRGNHDEHRDLERTSAFEVFRALLADVENITIVTGWWIHEEHLFLGWQPVTTAEELVLSAAQDEAMVDVTTAWGHWDVDTRSHPHNLIPTRALAELGVTKAYTGHIHLPDTFKRDGVDVTVVGSMQPYSFSEDAKGELYVTLTLEELKKCLQ